MNCDRRDTISAAAATSPLGLPRQPASSRAALVSCSIASAVACETGASRMATSLEQLNVDAADAQRR